MATIQLCAIDYLQRLRYQDGAVSATLDETFHLSHCLPPSPNRWTVERSSPNMLAVETSQQVHSTCAEWVHTMWSLQLQVDTITAHSTGGESDLPVATGGKVVKTGNHCTAHAQRANQEATSTSGGQDSTPAIHVLRKHTMSTWSTGGGSGK